MMKFIIQPQLAKKGNFLVLGLFEEDRHFYQFYDRKLAKEIEEAVKKKVFTPKFGEIFTTRISEDHFEKIIILGLGKKKSFSLEHLRRITGKAIEAVKQAKGTTFSTNILELLPLEIDEEKAGQAFAETVFLANYEFTKYLSAEKKEKKKSVQEIYLHCSKEKKIEAGLHKGRIIAEATNFTRDLVNEPANIANSIYLEKIARDVVAANPKCHLKVLEEKELKKLGMNALLGVNMGSEEPAKLLILEYKGGSGKPTAFVGKGIIFDSGGYNLKPTKYIEEMKSDMAGAAAVLGTIKAAAQLGVKKNLVGAIPLCENMISGRAQRPGDIVKAYNGKTIEIGNTDAEGRLILADALAYVEDKYQPEIIIDLATLTGACVVALGYYAAGLVSKEWDLSEKLLKAGLESGDRLWSLPFFEEYQDWMDGEISDLNNIAQKGKGYEAGSITAGVFLSKFVEKARWAHIDIAGSAYWGVKGDYLDKGATGSGVRVLSYYLLDN